MSVPQLAQHLGVSRVTIYKRVVQGKIQAEKVGHNYVVSAQTARKLLDERNAQIAAGVQKVVEEYGRVLERLGRE